MSLGVKSTVALLSCKLFRIIGKAIGKGSSMPGNIALKIDKNILSKISYPSKIIAVTGSNGKTSTTEMIVASLRACRLSVSYNSEGANQLDGIATFVLSDSNIKGILNYDAMVIEADEQSARHIFKYIKPDVFVITNLYRDQLSRNGHPERIFDIINQAIGNDFKLILNADDPRTASFGYNFPNAVFFGVNTSGYPSDSNSVYDDGAYCPVCGNKMTYKSRMYNHIGDYFCNNCTFSRPYTKYTVTDFTSDSITINGIKSSFSLIGKYNIHNMLAAYSAALEIGCDSQTVRNALSNYVLKSGRTVDFKIGDNSGRLLVSKHENSIAYDCSIDTVISYNAHSTVIIVVDSISRKYFTSDTSWLYDIDFEKLNCEYISKIVLAGKYCHDLSVRFSMTDIPQDKIIISERIPDAMEEFKYTQCGMIFVLTCFSDKAKVLSYCNVVEPGTFDNNISENIDIAKEDN